MEFKDENLQPFELNSNNLHCVLHFKRDGYSRSINYKQQKWVPYVSDPDKWYQHLLDIRDGLVELNYLVRYIVGSGEKHRRLKEMEAKQIEKQRPVVNLVSPVAQATEMARPEIKREREMAKSKTFVPSGRRQNVNRSITKDYF